MAIEICEKASPESIAGWTPSQAITEKLNYVQLGSALFEESSKQEKEGNLELSHSIALLGHICGLRINLEDHNNPFEVCVVLSGAGRTADINDFSDRCVLTIEKLSETSSCPAIDARINDFLWVRKRPRDPKFPKAAIEAYLHLCHEIKKNDIKNISSTKKHIRRAIQLWRQLGSDPKTKEEILSTLEECLVLDHDEPSNFVRVLVFEALPYVLDKEDDIKKWVEILEKGIQDSDSQRHFEKGRAYLEVLVNIYKNIDDQENVTATRSRITDLFIDEAKTMKDAGADPMILQSLYTKAIEACRRTEGKKEEARTLQKEMVELQIDVPKSYKQFSTPIDMTESIRLVKDTIEKSDFDACIKFIAGKTIPTPKKDYYESAEKIIKEFPLQGMLTAVITDEKGKVVARQPGASGSVEEKDAVLRARSSTEFNIAVQLKGTAIEVARSEMFNKFAPEHRSFLKYLMNNPFVPHTHIIQFEKGLQEGLKGNWIASTSILVPLLENSFRHIMQLAGHDMVKIDSEGIQQEKDLNSFIYSDEFCGLVGEDAQFQLQMLLTDKNGMNLRNNVAHGLLTDNAALSRAAQFTWALALLFILFFQNRFSGDIEDAKTST